MVNRGQAVVFQLQVHGGAGKHLDLDVARNQARERRGTETANRNIRTTIFEGGVPYDKLQVPLPSHRVSSPPRPPPRVRGWPRVDLMADS